MTPSDTSITPKTNKLLFTNKGEGCLVPAEGCIVPRCTICQGCACAGCQEANKGVTPNSLPTNMAKELAAVAYQEAIEGKRTLEKTAEMVDLADQLVVPGIKREFERLVQEGKTPSQVAGSAVPPINKTEKDQDIKMTTTSNNVSSGALRGDMPGIKREGKQLILPENMSTAEAITWLQRQMVEDEADVAVSEEVPGAYPMDAAIAFMKALKERYGWTEMVPSPGFFGPKPPTMVGVEIAPGKTIQVPWGRVQIPGVSGFLQTAFAMKDNRPIFAITGVVKRKDRAEVTKIAERTRELVRDESIYRGKAIRVHFNDPNETGVQFNPAQGPTFMDLVNVKTEELIFPAQTQKMITDALFTPIEKTELCRKYAIPRKRGILLAGPYGTGKSLTASVTAKKCEDNKWTFIYLQSVKQLQEAIYFAQQYSPAVIFSEDIDQVVTGGRTQQVNEILNTIDGIDTKHSELIVVLTTNHIENIEKAMLRPGRLDAVIQVRPPDQEAVIRLIKLYSRGILRANDAELVGVAQKLQGNIPAFIRETVERAKLSAVTRLENSDQMHINATDLEAASDSLLEHLELMKEEVEDERSDEEKAAQVIAGSITQVAEAMGNKRVQEAESKKQHPVLVHSQAKKPGVLRTTGNGKPSN